MTMGEKIDIVLQDRGIDNRRAAKLLGTRENLLSMWKYDERPMPLRHVIRFCKEFNLDANWFLGLEENG